MNDLIQSFVDDALKSDAYIKVKKNKKGGTKVEVDPKQAIEDVGNILQVLYFRNAYIPEIQNLIRFLLDPVGPSFYDDLYDVFGSLDETDVDRNADIGDEIQGLWFSESTGAEFADDLECEVNYGRSRMANKLREVYYERYVVLAEDEDEIKELFERRRKELSVIQARMF